jgi:uncharacterized protein (DUF2267 family)
MTHSVVDAARATEDWIDDFVRRLGWRDRDRAYSALIAALHALRSCLQQDEVIYLGAQLPALLRGQYYEGWHPKAHLGAKNRGAFLERVYDNLHRDPGVDAEVVARTMFALLAARLPAAEVENAKASTPYELHNLWPS